jgi:hypothetical protein
VFEAVRAKLMGNRKRKTPWLGGGNLLLSGMMTCGHCGSRMVGVERFGPRVYVCSGNKKWGKAVCNRNSVSESKVVHFLMKKLQETCLNPDNLVALRQEIKRQAAATTESPARSGRLKAQMDALEKKIAKGNRNMALAEADALPGIAEAVREWRAERDRLARELAEAENGPDVAAAEADIARAEASLWRLREGIASDEPADVRAVLRELIDRVELWWEHRKVGPFTKCRFSRGVVYLRPDESLLHSCNNHIGSGGVVCL